MDYLKLLVPLNDLHTIGDIKLGKGEVCLVARKSGVGGDVKNNGDLLEHHCHNHGYHKNLFGLVMLEERRLIIGAFFSTLFVVGKSGLSLSLIDIDY
jgi:hypothetical protein